MEPRDKEGALKYAHYLATHGTKYKYFEATDIRYGRFKGLDLENFPEENRKLKEAYNRLEASHDNVKKAPVRIRKWLSRIRRLWRRKQRVRMLRRGDAICRGGFPKIYLEMAGKIKSLFLLCFSRGKTQG